MFSVGAEVDVLSAVPAQSLKPLPPSPSPSPSPPTSKYSRSRADEAIPKSASYTNLPTSHEAPPTSIYNRSRPDEAIPKSASYTNLSDSHEAPRSDGIKRTFSDNFLSNSTSEGSHEPSPYMPNKELLRRLSRGGQGKVAVTRFTLSADDLGGLARKEIPKPEPAVVEKRASPARSVSGTLRNLARKTWRSSSRSPSPAPHDVAKRVQGSYVPPRKALPPTAAPAAAPTSSLASSLTNYARQQPPPDPPSTNRQRPSLQRRLSRPLSAIISPIKAEHGALKLRKPPSLQSLKSQRSSEKLSQPSPASVPPLPTSLSSDKLSSIPYDPNRKKDPLWGVFRNLEGDYQKFHSKTTSLKANVVRTCLLTFLSKYADHPSNASLRSEDLDRRVMILNKWWIGLIEMLNGRHNLSVSGTDRPIFLEGITGVMARAEWRTPLSISPKQPDTPAFFRQGMQTSSSLNSFESGGSDFLTESVHHNVRNIFIQNLLSQMAFVVEKMSMRSAPASLVAFCGTTCAYAFFFCPGVADLLVRLWHLPSDLLKRVMTELGVPRGTKIGVRSVEVASHFPLAIRNLAINSHAALVKTLHHKMPLPLGAAFIRWYGPWVGRWNGRDSDLFFSFVKNYHQLVVEIFPRALEKEIRACVPGLVLVHAQILAVLEATLYRQAGQQQPDMYASNALDDLDTPDAALSLPHTTANATRSMAENRLVQLLRELLSDTNPEQQPLRDLYAQSFDAILKVATRKVSIYNSDACFVLCDLMEEILSITSSYNRYHPETPVLDWPFWLQVCKQLMASENTLTEIRLLAFLYTTWNILVDDTDRRRDLCLDWLLEPSFFDKNFNHWCPMVRAYYLRLVCWRVARHDGEACELDVTIYKTLLERLNISWSFYLYLKDQAEKDERTLPSSAPCSPAPSRRLVIIRSDTGPSPADTLTSFDTMISRMSSSHLSTSSTANSSDTVVSNNDRNHAKKRWSFMKNIIPFSTPGNNRPGEVTPPASPDDSSISSSGKDKPDFSDTLLSKALSPPAASKDTPAPTPTSPNHQSFLFKFSLEWLDRHNWPSKNRRLVAPELPFTAQELIQSHSQEEGEGEPAPLIEPKNPGPQKIAYARYTGRALAEWAQIVSEYQSFFERRRDEGVPSNRAVETPTLGVETFRMAG